MGILTRSRDELLREMRKELEDTGSRLEERLQERSRALEERLVAIERDLSSIAAQRVLPEEFLSRVNQTLDRAEKVSKELESVREYESWLASVQDGLHDVVELLSKERKAAREDVERLQSEKAELETMKTEFKRWRSELEEKERNLASYSQMVFDLERRRTDLETELKELEGKYVTKYGEIVARLDVEIGKIDRMFKLKEIRLERLVRKERDVSDAVLRMREREEALQDAEKRLAELKTEIGALESRRESLWAELRDLEERKESLGRLVGERRGALLSP